VLLAAIDQGGKGAAIGVLGRAHGFEVPLTASSRT
jgi:hypothetical protein